MHQKKTNKTKQQQIERTHMDEYSYFKDTYSIDVPKNVFNLLPGMSDVFFVAVSCGRGFVQAVQQQRVSKKGTNNSVNR
jgi:hypothetical protein